MASFLSEFLGGTLIIYLQTIVSDHVRREKCSHQPLWSEIKILDREHRGVRYLKEWAYTVGYKDLFRKPIKEINTIWESLINSEREMSARLQ